MVEKSRKKEKALLSTFSFDSLFPPERIQNTTFLAAENRLIFEECKRLYKTSVHEISHNSADDRCGNRNHNSLNRIHPLFVFRFHVCFITILFEDSAENGQKNNGHTIQTDCVTVFISVVLPTLFARASYWRCSRMAACAALRRAMGTRKGEQET